MLVDKYTDCLSFKFYEDPFIGYGEIAETKLAMHIYPLYVCIFRYYLIIHVFLAHQWCEYKNIYMELFLYFFKIKIHVLLDNI